MPLAARGKAAQNMMNDIIENFARILGRVTVDEYNTV
jgi:hypothetical protein